MFQRYTLAGLWMAALLVASGCCAPHVMCGGGCGVADCGPCGGCGPDLLKAHTYKAMTCDAGCGGVYWDEWVNDPPAACDPCDNHGNWIGPNSCGTCGPCGASFWSGLHSLWGYRYGPGGCGDGSCAGGCSTCGGEVSYGMPMKAEPMRTPNSDPKDVVPPTPAKPVEPEATQTSVTRATYRNGQLHYTRR